MKQYRIELDVLKAVCIIAVVLYHVGVLKTGYLGVDAFLVINGFLVIPPLIKKAMNETVVVGGGISLYINWLRNRLLRLWPLVLLASMFCLVVGFIGLLPDDYENLSQSVIASDLMSNNILLAITSKNYWDVSNDFKPLMHFWYVGILVEFYVLYAFLVWCCKFVTDKVMCNFEKCVTYLLVALCMASIALYMVPSIPQHHKFFYLPCRLFEFILGGLVGLYLLKENTYQLKQNFGIVALILIVAILLSSLYLPYTFNGINEVSGLESTVLLVPQNILLLCVVLLTCFFVWSKSWNTLNSAVKGVAFIGKLSFGIFVWHQILLAFYRCIVGTSMTASVVFGVLIASIVLAVITYYGLEKRIVPTWRVFCVCIGVLILTFIPAGYIYVNAGVVRDVPELSVQKSNVRRGMHAEYCDRVNAYNKDFPQEDNGKLNVLVVGNSFGRDFGNILIESEWFNKINLSYIVNEFSEDYKNRISKSDFIFTFHRKDKVPQYVFDLMKPDAEIFGLGTKNFGENNSIVYKHRNRPDYFESTIDINPNFYTLNNEWKETWREENYIDFIKYSTASDGKIRVFTDDGKFISQDTRHLTQDGAKWFASVIDFDAIFNR